jgi:hypothetical protein
MLDTRLDAALAAPDPWTAIAELAADPPGGPVMLAERASKRFEGASQDEQRLLSHLLSLLHEDGTPVLLDLLARIRSTELLASAVYQGLMVPAPVLDGLVEQMGYTALVIDALGLSGDRGRAEALGGLLRNDDLCGRAALALARLGAREWTVPIARHLREVNGLTHVACAVALEQMGDPAAVPSLLNWLACGPDLPAGDVHRALVRLTGRDPLIPEWSTTKDYSAHVRHIWPSLDLATPPTPEVRDLVPHSPSHLSFSLDEGRGQVRVDYDPPSPGSLWPRWNKTLHVGQHALYRVGSDCGTCETMMSLLGFPPANAKTGAAQVREALADLHELTAATVRALEPVIHELTTGHYKAHLVDLPLERVGEPQRSWWQQRIAARDDSESLRTEDTSSWPGTEHFQTPRPIPAARPAYGSLLPSQPLDALRPATIERHASAIERGERPAALLLAWTEDRYVQAEWEERFLLGVILDGHHRLAAYAATEVPARVLILGRTEQHGTLEEVINAL